jgi:uncharacterized protein (TIGR03066 family)
MQAARWFLASGLVLFFFTPSFAQEKVADLIVGKWEAKEKMGDQEVTGILEFTKDGKLKITFGGINIDGTYKLLSDTEIEVTMTFMGETKTEKSEIKVEKESLEVKNKNGKSTKFKKVK